MMGYFFVYLGESYFERKELYSDLSMTLPSETMVNFQIPLTYYPQPNREPEDVRGEFVYKGKYYDLNKQWVKNDTLFIEAFENGKQKLLEQSLYQHVQDHVLDHQSKSPLEKSKRILANLLKDYLPETQFLLAYKEITFFSKSTLIPTIPHFSTRFLEINSPPPQRFC
jgi:hypothetical protein